MSYNQDDPAQNAYWDEDVAKKLDAMANELYGQAQEAHRLEYSRIEQTLMNAYQALINAAAALREEEGLLQTKAQDADMETPA